MKKKHPPVRNGAVVWSKEKLIEFLITYKAFHKRWPRYSDLRYIRPNNRTINRYFGSLKEAIREAQEIEENGKIEVRGG